MGFGRNIRRFYKHHVKPVIRKGKQIIIAAAQKYAEKQLPGSGFMGSGLTSGSMISITKTTSKTTNVTNESFYNITDNQGNLIIGSHNQIDQSGPDMEELLRRYKEDKRESDFVNQKIDRSQEPYIFVGEENLYENIMEKIELKKYENGTRRWICNDIFGVLTHKAQTPNIKNIMLDVENQVYDAIITNPTLKRRDMNILIGHIVHAGYERAESLVA